MISVALTSLYWAIEEGIVGTIVKSLSAGIKSIVSFVSGIGSWCKNTITSMFKPSMTKPQTEAKEEQILTAEAVDANQNKTVEPQQNTFMPSGGYDTQRQRATVVPPVNLGLLPKEIESEDLTNEAFSSKHPSAKLALGS